MKRFYHLCRPAPDPFLVNPASEQEPDPEPLILWTVKLYDHVLFMPELEALIQAVYFEN